MKTKLLILSLSLFSACTLTDTNTVERQEMEDSLAQLLNTVPAVQQIKQPEHEEVLIPRNAPWLGNRVDAQYQDSAREAIKTVLQGRPVFFELANEQLNPVVTAPVDATTVIEHLDAISVQADWSYSIADGVVVVTDTITRQFNLHAIPGIGMGRVSLGSTSGTGIQNSLDLSSAPYRDLDQALRSLTASYAARRGSGSMGSENIFSLVAATNTLTVNGPPSLMRRVARLVEDFNDSVSRKVHLTITVYDVSFSNSSQRSIDFDLLRQAAIASNLTFQGSSLVQTTPGALSLGLDFFEGNELDSSTVVFNLLRQQGNTSVKLHEAFEATNNLLFSIEEQRTTPYISQVSLQRQDGGSISSLTPAIELEKENTGLGFHVVATISGENVNVRLSLSQSDIVRFDPYAFGSGESSISGKIPITDRQNRMIPMTLKDGETRLIANLTQSQFSNDSAGSGLFGIGRSDAVDNSEKQTVIAVTAKIL